MLWGILGRNLLTTQIILGPRQSLCTTKFLVLFSFSSLHFLRDVQLLVACCIADILRIFAPEAPYKDPAQIKTIFYFLIKQLGGLKDPKVNKDRIMTLEM